jgi:hypothetical protein
MVHNVLNIESIKSKINSFLSYIQIAERSEMSSNEEVQLNVIRRRVERLSIEQLRPIALDWVKELREGRLVILCESLRLWFDIAFDTEEDWYNGLMLGMVGHHQGIAIGSWLPITTGDFLWNIIDNDDAKEEEVPQLQGRAIERFAKNANFNSLLVVNEEIYPYILFGAGCDFHETETIAGRLRQGNFGKQNIRNPNAEFSIFKERGNPTINIFLKSHKWDVGTYGCSDWTIDERKNILVKTMKMAITYYYNKYKTIKK